MVERQPDIVGVIEREGVSLKREGKLFVGKCPFHADDTPSFKAFPQTNSWYCFGSCQCGGDAIEFVKKLHNKNFKDACAHLEIQLDENQAPKNQRVVETFTYTDGVNTYYKDRLEPGRGGRSKEFQSWSFKDGERQYVRGCEPLIYNGHKITEADVVIFVEGERKADLINAWKIPDAIAVCLDAGAGSPWKPEYTEVMRGKDKVIIIPDNDEAGEKYAMMVAKQVSETADKIKIIKLPDLAEKEDVVDWVRHGGTREAFIDFIKNSPVWNKEANIFDSKASIASIFTDSLLYWNGIRKGEIKFIPACTIFSSHVNAYVKKHINVVSGYTSAGKSTLLAQVLVELGRLGAEVDVFSLEDSREEKFMTMIAVMTGVHKRKMILGTFSDDEKKKITEAAAEAINWKIRIYDTIRTIPDMEKIIRSSLASVICLDYVQNLFIDRNSIYEKMSFAAQEIFRLATQYNQTWNVLSQVSNDSVRNESDLMGLKGAGELSAIANSVMELKKGRKEENIHKVTLKVKKNKTFGPCGDIELHYNEGWTKLERDDMEHESTEKRRYPDE